METIETKCLLTRLTKVSEIYIMQTIKDRQPQGGRDRT